MAGIPTPSLREGAFGDRFEVRSALGAGGFGDVFEAYDLERRDTVAIKVLHETRGSNLFRFKREFRSLTRLSHQNLVQLYELLSDGDDWLFTMELVRGQDFLSYVCGDWAVSDAITREFGSVSIADIDTLDTETAPATDPSIKYKPVANLNVDRLLDATRQLAEGIHTLHESGKLHRDLKPPNVLVSDEGRVVILDFGMVADLTPSHRQAVANAPPGNAVPILGTPLYMSPEQTGSAPAGEASDWYSFGVMLFEAMTGHYPVEGDSLVQILLRKHTTAPPTPDVFPETCPKNLVELCCRLLEPDPEARPRGDEILRVLGAGSANVFSDSRADFLESPLFVGRQTQLRELDRALFDVRHSRSPQVANIIGPSGIGKTCVVQEFLDRMSERALVLDGRCYENESVPYKAVDSVIDRLAETMRNEYSPSPIQLIEGDLEALVRLFPVLRRIPAIADVVGDEDDVQEVVQDSALVKRRAIATLRALLHELAEMHELVIFIDDVQWGDHDSATLLTDVFRAPGAPPVLLLTTYRDNHPDSDFIQEFRRGMVEDQIEIRDLRLQEFETDDATHLIAQLLGNEASSSAVDVIRREAKGSPFFIETLARHARTQTLESGLTSLADVISHRIDQLPDEARSLLQIVALAGQPVERQVAREAAYLEDEAAKSIALLRNERLITLKTHGDNQALETYHDRIRETVRDRMEPDAKRRNHLRLGRLLERNQADPERLAVHFRAGGVQDKAADYTLQAAKQAREALAFDRAARLYRDALQLKANWKPEEQRQILVNLGQTNAYLARGSESAEAFLRAAESSDELERVSLTSQAAEQMIRSGQFERGQALLYDVLRRVGAPTPETDGAALRGVVLKKGALWWRGTDFKLRDQPLDPALDVRLEAMWTASNLMATIDVKLGAFYQMAHVIEALDSGAPMPIMRSLSMQAVHESTAARSRAKAQPLLDQAATLVENHEFGPSMPSWLEFCGGMVQYMSGRFGAGYRQFLTSAEILEKHASGVAWELANVKFYYLFCLWPMGKFRAFDAVLDEMLDDAIAANDFMHIAGLRLWSYVSYLARDQPDLALEEAERGIQSWTNRGYHLQHFWYLLARTNTALYEGDGARAYAVVEEDWPKLKRSLLLETQVAKLIALETRARACIGAAVDGNAKALKEAKKHVRAIEREDVEWVEGVAAMLRAEIAMHEGDPSKAVDLYSKADVGCSNADMVHWAASARYRLGCALGGERGERISQEALGILADEDVKDPVRMVALIAPTTHSG